METPENLATHGTQDDGKKQKNKKNNTTCVDTTIRKQTKLDNNVKISKAIFNLRWLF